jgi:hypothetical protein
VPPVTIESGPAATTPDRAATFNFSAEGRGLRYECAITTAPALPTSAQFGLCTSPKTYTGVPLGTHTFHDRVHAPEATNEPPISTYTWRVIETRAPITTIDFGPTSPSESTTADFAYSADEGHLLWEYPTPEGVIGGPMTYELDGTQYIAVMAGWGGAYGLRVGSPERRSGREQAPSSFSDLPTTGANPGEANGLCRPRRPASA